MFPALNTRLVFGLNVRRLVIFGLEWAWVEFCFFFFLQMNWFWGSVPELCPCRRATVLREPLIDPGSTAIRQQFPMSGHSLEFNFALVILDNRVTPSFFIAFPILTTYFACWHMPRLNAPHSTVIILILLNQTFCFLDNFTTTKTYLQLSKFS